MSHKDHPINYVRWVPLAKVVANDYNPNKVARNEMRLLALSIRSDGYTQPIVTIYDEERDQYVIVDGFHRYLVMRTYSDIQESTGGLLPIVVLDKPKGERMASTIRHNRARGKHALAGMGSMVFSLLERGWPDERICNELGLEAEELLRLKHVTGFSALFDGVEYGQAWETDKQVRLRKEYERNQAGQDAAREAGGAETVLAEPEEQPGDGGPLGEVHT